MRNILIIIALAISLMGNNGNVNKSQTQTYLKLNIGNKNPLVLNKQTAPQYKIEINTTSPYLFRKKHTLITRIVPGDSNFTKKQLAASATTNTSKSSKIAARPERTKFTGNLDVLYKEASAKYGIPWQVLAAVHSVETGQSGDTQVSSYAGAQGPMQFMPATWRAYGVDGDGDGIANIHGVVDAVYSAARYLAANYNKTGSIQHAIWQYNHSQAYVSKVLSIARSFGYTG